MDQDLVVVDARSVSNAIVWGLEGRRVSRSVSRIFRLGTTTTAATTTLGFRLRRLVGGGFRCRCLRLLSIGGRFVRLLGALARAPGQIGLEVIRADQIFDVKEGCALLPDIDESRLHPRQDPAHGAEANVAEGALGAEAFDVKLGDDAGLDQGNADFANIDVDDEKIPAHDIFCALPAANPEAMTEHRAEAVGDIKEHLVGAASGIARVGQMARFTDWL